MAAELQRKLGRARRRWLADRLLETAARTAVVAGLLAAGAIATQRAFAIPILTATVLWSAAGAWAVLTLGLWWARRPGTLAVAILADRRMRFRERFSTAVALADSDDPFAAAARAEARGAAERLDVRAKFPVRPSRSWAVALATWALFAGLLAFLPTMDLFGHQARQEEKQKQAVRLDQAKTEIKQATAVVKAAVDRLADKQLADELKQLGDLKTVAKPTELRRQTIRKLSDLSERIKKMRDSGEYRRAAALKERMKKLRGFPKSKFPELQRALARGRPEDAAEALQELQKKLRDGKVSDAEKEALARELADLAKQLEQLGDRDKAAEDLLEREGLDKRLAKMTDEELRKALEQKGLTEEQIDRLREKLERLGESCRSCGKLGEAMAGACQGGGRSLSPEEFDALLDQLDEMSGRMERIALVEGSLDDIDKAIALLGEGQCPGGLGLSLDDQGGQGAYQAGASTGRGRGTGGPGKGYGARDTADGGKVGHTKTQVRGKTGKGPMIASRLFRGRQLKGKARRELAEVTRAARDAAAEAISDKRIPRKYESAVKDYFGDMEKVGRTPKDAEGGR